MSRDPQMPGGDGGPQDEAAGQGAMLPRHVEVAVSDAASGERLDRYLASSISDLSRARLQAMIREGLVRINSACIRDPGQRVKAGDVITVTLRRAVSAEPQGEQIPLVIVYEDDQLIVVDKPAGLVVHPAPGHATGTLVNALIAHCGASLSGIGGVRRPGIVHRLDKDTSGLMVVAKTDAAHKGLSSQFASHGADGRLERAYLAVVWGAPVRPAGEIDLALTRASANRTKIAVTHSGDGRHAVTHYVVEETFQALDDARGRRGAGRGRVPRPRSGADVSVPAVTLASMVRLTLETGRTHQIRVHMAALGHPLLGDGTYGAGFATRASRLSPAAAEALVGLNRQALHATVLGFEHPVTGEPLSFESAPPDDLATLIDALRADHGH